MSKKLDFEKMLSKDSQFNAKANRILSLHLIFDPNASDNFIEQSSQIFLNPDEKVCKVEADVIDGCAPQIINETTICIIIAASSKYIGEIILNYTRAKIPCLALFSANNTMILNKLDLAATQNNQEFPKIGLPRNNIISLDSNKSGLYNFIGLSKWLVANDINVGILFAKAYPSFRKSIANEYIISRSVDNFALSLSNFLPYKGSFNDLTYTQVSMILDLAIMYNQVIDESRTKELVAVLGLAIGSKSFAKKLIEKTKIAPFIIKGFVPLGVTYYLGKLAISYFESGASLIQLIDELK